MSYAKVPNAVAVCELRLRADRSGWHEVASRAQITDWRKDTKGNWLPVTAFGPLTLRAFVRSADAGAMMVLEVCRPDGTRAWTLPGLGREIDDASVNRSLHRAVTKSGRQG